MPIKKFKFGSFILFSKKLGMPIKMSLRLQPIMDLHHNGIMGYEVLSQIPDIDAEVFFSSIEEEFILRLAKRQVAMINLYAHMANKNHLLYFINIIPSMIDNKLFIDWVCDYSETKIAFELDYSVIKFSPKINSSENLDKLKSYGHQIWLDDFNKNILDYHHTQSNSIIEWDGVKIDKYLFWSECSSTQKLKKLVSDCKNISQNIIVEGIESWFQMFITKQTDISYGQGFYWDDIKL